MPRFKPFLDFFQAGFGGSAIFVMMPAQRPALAVWLFSPAGLAEEAAAGVETLLGHAVGRMDSNRVRWTRHLIGVASLGVSKLPRSELHFFQKSGGRYWSFASKIIPKELKKHSS